MVLERWASKVPRGIDLTGSARLSERLVPVSIPVAALKNSA